MFKVNQLPQNIDIGYVGEQQFRPIEIDMSPWMAKMPDGVPSIVHTRPGESDDDAYIVATTFENNVLTWTISASDLGSDEGVGIAQVWLEEEENNTLNKRGMSAVFATIIHGSVGNQDPNIPPSQLPWLQQMTGLKTATVVAAEEAQAAQEAAEAAQEAAEAAQGAAEAAQEAAETAQGAAETAQAAAETSEENSEAWAVGQRGGADVGSSDPTYHNNSKYYSGQAADSASTASAASTAASGAKDDAVSAKNAAVSAKNDAVTAKNDAVTAKNAAVSAKETAESWATGGSSGTPGASNNAKYYSEQAASSATTASTKAGEASGSATAASNKAGEAATSATSAETQALKAEGFAVGEQNGTDVGSGSPYYHNNAEYYAGQASGSATTATTQAGNASGSATTAGNKALVAEGFANGEQNGTPVSSGDYYHNNAKYFSEQAADSATAAAGSADDAADSAAEAEAIATMVAPVFDAEVANPAGSYVTKDGVLYFLPEGHEEDAAWADTTKEETKVVTELAGVKNAITRPEFIAGNAEEVLSDRGETDSAVYLFRKTGGTKKAYNREKVQKLVGGTVAWNQLIKVVASAVYNGVTITYTSNGIYNVNGTGGTRSSFFNLTGATIANHVYITIPNISGSNVYAWQLGFSSDSHTNTVITKRNTVNGFGLIVMEGTTADNVKASLAVIDLTQMFGSTIADYLYTLETQTAGSGVALFRSLFDKSYYAYNSGSLESVNVSEHRLTGKNLFVESADAFDTTTSGSYAQQYINVPSGTEIIMSLTDKDTSISLSDVYFGAFEKTTNQGAFTWFVSNGSIDKRSFSITGKQYITIYPKTALQAVLQRFNIQVEIGSTATEYEPYQQFVYSMPNVTLRGIPKLVNNEIVFDGDELTPDGTVTRKYGIVDLGTLTWNLWPNYSHIFRAEILSNMKTVVNEAEAPFVQARYGLVQGVDMLTTDKSIAMLHKQYIAINDSAYSDATTFTTSMSGVYLVYELVTPTTESADGYQELQVCNRYGTEEYVDRLATAETSPRDVAIPCGHQTFYPVNVFDYIDELTKPDNNFIADANIASGKYFSVGNGLYLSAQAIAQGETIIPGTNCTAVSLADALNAINQ